MGRDSNGNYSSPSGAFVSGTTIDSAVMNGKLNDIGSEITNSLDRNGQGGMLTYLRGVDGTVNLPAYSFTSETTLGFMRNGSGDLRAVKDGTSLFKFSTTENRSYVPFKVSAGGIVVDAGGATVTAGGLTVTAGGLTVTGTLPAQGGVDGVAQVTASGATSATDLETFALQSLKATTPGSSTVRLTTRTINRGAVTDWEQVDLGLSYDVGTVVGQGGSIFLGKNGVTLNSGTSATAADPAIALTLGNGHIRLNGTAPNSDEALANTLTPANIVKAWGKVVTDAAGNATLVDGFNVASVTVTTGGATTTVKVALQQDMSNDDYSVILTGQRAGTGGYMFTVAAQTTADFDVNCTQLNPTGPSISTILLNNVAVTFYFQVVGRQA